MPPRAIPPLVAQISEILDSLALRRARMRDADARACPICMDRDREWALECGHVYCEACKDQFLAHCPTCDARNTQPARRVYF